MDGYATDKWPKSTLLFTGRTLVLDFQTASNYLNVEDAALRFGFACSVTGYLLPILPPTSSSSFVLFSLINNNYPSFSVAGKKPLELLERELVMVASACASYLIDASYDADTEEVLSAKDFDMENPFLKLTIENSLGETTLTPPPQLPAPPALIPSSSSSPSTTTPLSSVQLSIGSSSASGSAGPSSSSSAEPSSASSKLTPPTFPRAQTQSTTPAQATASTQAYASASASAQIPEARSKAWVKTVVATSDQIQFLLDFVGPITDEEISRRQKEAEEEVEEVVEEEEKDKAKKKDKSKKDKKGKKNKKDTKDKKGKKDNQKENEKSKKNSKEEKKEKSSKPSTNEEETEAIDAGSSQPGKSQNESGKETVPIVEEPIMEPGNGLGRDLARYLERLHAEKQALAQPLKIANVEEKQVKEEGDIVDAKEKDKQAEKDEKEDKKDTKDAEKPEIKDKTKKGGKWGKKGKKVKKGKRYSDSDSSDYSSSSSSSLSEEDVHKDSGSESESGESSEQEHKSKKVDKKRAEKKKKGEKKEEIKKTKEEEEAEDELGFMGFSEMFDDTEEKLAQTKISALTAESEGLHAMRTAFAAILYLYTSIFSFLCFVFLLFSFL